MDSKMSISLEKILRPLMPVATPGTYTIMVGIFHMRPRLQEIKRGNTKLKELSYSTKLQETQKGFCSLLTEKKELCMAYQLIDIFNQSILLTV
jgi:hypothetical protein